MSRSGNPTLSRFAISALSPPRQHVFGAAVSDNVPTAGTPVPTVSQQTIPIVGSLRCQRRRMGPQLFRLHLVTREKK